ncbi:hypothetical protein BGZ75_002132, partial [Mortierella antarctica]
PTEMVQEYLSHSLVHRKNVDGKTFKEAVRVFVQLEQTPRQSAVNSQEGQGSVSVTYDTVRQHYVRVCQRSNEIKKLALQQK